MRRREKVLEEERRGLYLVVEESHCCSSCAMRALKVLYSSFYTIIFRGGRYHD